MNPRRPARNREQKPLSVEVRDGEHMATAIARHIAAGIAGVRDGFIDVGLPPDGDDPFEELTALAELLTIQLSIALAPPMGSLHFDAIGDVPVELRMAALCATFHVLHGVPGTDPWNAAALDRWLDGPDGGTAGRNAARFVLGVWNNNHPRAKELEVLDAIAQWDEHNRAAFVTWAARPWWA